MEEKKGDRELPQLVESFKGNLDESVYQGLKESEGWNNEKKLTRSRFDLALKRFFSSPIDKKAKEAKDG